MTLSKLIEKLKTRDIYDIYIWLTWFAEKIDCKSCVETKKSQSGIPPNCSKCIPTFKLIKLNFPEKKEINNDQSKQK